MERLDTDVVVIGSGFSGIAMGIALRAAGRDFVILEKAADIGGTWRDNRYPGVACDVPSHLYSYSFELNPLWSRAYAPGDEIQDYLLYVVEKYRLRPHVRFRHTVQHAWYDEKFGVWEVVSATPDGLLTTLRCRDLVVAVGQLHSPAIPDLPGLADFRGEVMHTSSWEPGTTVHGKRVGVIGTGATAVQIIPELAQDAARLSVFQRTPTWVMPKIDPEYSDSLAQTYEKRPWLMRAHRAKLKTFAETRSLGFTKQPLLMQAASLVARQHLHSAVSDANLRDRLTPAYVMGCKRIPLSDDYYPAFARDNVELVTDAITQLDATGVRTADGAHHELDLLVLATGFDPRGAYRALGVVGARGASLSHDIDAGLGTYYGVTAADYPNLFFLLGPNTLLGHTSVLLMMEAQVELVMKLLAERDRRGAAVVAVRPEVVAPFTAEMQQRSHGSVWETGCRSWYLNTNGDNYVLWPGSVPEYERRVRRPEMVDYEFTTPPGG
ncbi:NAD(P)/FAD-dependent oxidoreductase [Calidifontibacter sp. DB0510]|uniref:NAD(P)/FAD-dependent oxidoreductase n=1 Tax=Metallococcus carri TaxID=1656884 RepID=A0A967B3Z8_9MICO|nr:NAD(P)/FAD-dependent oxidoreductase [Metallococcus carri]NHN57118.1 NAD(P)/FAD-dependent oxidoreductase [Metallococcus carri]NOP39013.1 NAD(P)/FAD-dependent oxidoreductase [Calidifontibacter sp. DB2511S]